MNKVKPIRSLAFFPLLLASCISCACSTVSPLTCNNSMTDNDITTNIQVKIGCERGLADNNVQVSTFERVVTLTGTVENPTQADVAYVLAKSVPNVKCVISKITLTHPERVEARGQWFD